jgi:2-oxoisovalerate dehydrogenase E1 component alpha subunit
MRKGVDVWVPYYRDGAVVLAAGMTPYEIFLGIFAKADDPSSGGRQMPSHWGHKGLDIISGSSPIATQIPHAAGIAYAIKYRQEDAVVGCWFGDGATSEGDWHEGLNFAAIHKLPVLFVCENNEYAISVRQEKQMAVRDVASRAEGYGMPGEVVDGSDLLACYAAMRSARERAIAGEGPTLIECKTYRYLPHTSDDDDKTYRPRSEVDEHRHSDPIDRFAAYLLEHQLADAAALEAMQAAVVAEVEAAITAAWDAPDPDPATAMRHVFAEDDDPTPP